MTPHVNRNGLKPGWLKRQADHAARDIASWPTWMRQAAGIVEQSKAQTRRTSTKRKRSK